MSDIHGNREAFEACLQHAAAQNARRYIFLGGYVGYGADDVRGLVVSLCGLGQDQLVQRQIRYGAAKPRVLGL